MSTVSATDIALELSERLAAITVANGYHTDIGLRVYRGRRKLGVEVVPCTVLVELEDTALDATRSGLVKLAQVYAIEGHVVCDPDNPNDAAHLVIKDLKRAVFGTPFMAGALQVSTIAYRGRVIGVRDEGAGIIPASIRIAVTYSEDLRNP